MDLRPFIFTFFVQSTFSYKFMLVLVRLSRQTDILNVNTSYVKTSHPGRFSFFINPYELIANHEKYRKI